MSYDVSWIKRKVLLYPMQTVFPYTERFPISGHFAVRGYLPSSRSELAGSTDNLGALLALRLGGVHVSTMAI